MDSMVVFFECRDLKAVDHFYQKRLGLALWNQQPGCHIYDTGYGYLGFVENPQFVLPAYSCISFNCSYEQIAQWYLLFQDDEGTTVPQMHPKFRVYSFFAKDPSGYRIEFQHVLKEETQ